MTVKPTTCVHGVRLTEYCDPCHESYGNTRPTEELKSAEIKTKNLRFLERKDGRKILQQQHVENGGAGAYRWVDIELVKEE